MTSSVEFDDQKRADEMNSLLPVNLTASDAKQNPCLMILLSSLSTYIAPDGQSKTFQKDVADALETLKKAKLKWLQNTILLTEIKDFIIDSELKAATVAGNGSQFYKTVQELVSFAEAASHVETSPDPSTGVTLLGLNVKDIEQANPHRLHLQSIQQQLIPEVELKLRRRCEALVDFYEPNTNDAALPDGGGSRLNFAKASQLPALLEEHLSHIEARKLELNNLRRAKRKQIDLYQKSISKCLGLLEDIVTRHQLRSQAEFDRVTCDWLSANCDTMCLKIKLLELQLLCDTYHEQTVKALRIIKSHLDKAIRSTEQELQSLSTLSQNYTAIGSQFEAVVSEYAHICDEINNKKWALRELRTSMDKNEN